MKKSIASLIVILAALPLNAQTTLRDRWADSARVLIETAVRHGSTAGIDSARTILDRVMTAMPNDPLLLHYDAYALYRKVTLANGRGQKLNVRPLLERASEELDKSGAKLALPETFSLKAAVYGQIIATSKNPLTAMTMGMKSGSAADKAVETGPANPRVWLLKGIGAIFTPSMFGGGLDKAQEYLEKSVTLFASDNPPKPLPAWGRAEVFIWLGQVYAKQGKANAARDAYQKAIDIEPDNGWARGLLAGNIAPVG